MEDKMITIHLEMTKETTDNNKRFSKQLAIINYYYIFMKIGSI